MKKGYQCPRCGNRETGSMLVDRDGCELVAVFMLPQKILRKPDVRISCSDCGWLEGAERFRTCRPAAAVYAP